MIPDLLRIVFSSFFFLPIFFASKWGKNAKKNNISISKQGAKYTTIHIRLVKTFLSLSCIISKSECCKIFPNYSNLGSPRGLWRPWIPQSWKTWTSTNSIILLHLLKSTIESLSMCEVGKIWAVQFEQQSLGSKIGIPKNE